MATVAMDISKPTPAASGDEAAAAAKGRSGAGGEGLRQYYLQHIHDLQLQIRQKTHNLNRLEAQRNDLNSRGETSSRLLRPPSNPRIDVPLLRRGLVWC
jgi:26S proteasome regulatory subunit T6